MTLVKPRDIKFTEKFHWLRKSRYTRILLTIVLFYMKHYVTANICIFYTVSEGTLIFFVLRSLILFRLN